MWPGFLLEKKLVGALWIERVLLAPLEATVTHIQRGAAQTAPRGKPPGSKEAQAVNQVRKYTHPRGSFCQISKPTEGGYNSF